MKPRKGDVEEQRLFTNCTALGMMLFWCYLLPHAAVGWRKINENTWNHRKKLQQLSRAWKVNQLSYLRVSMVPSPSWISSCQIFQKEHRTWPFEKNWPSLPKLLISLWFYTTFLTFRYIWLTQCRARFQPCPRKQPVSPWNPDLVWRQVWLPGGTQKHRSNWNLQSEPCRPIPRMHFWKRQLDNGREPARFVSAMNEWNPEQNHG